MPKPTPKKPSKKTAKPAVEKTSKVTTKAAAKTTAAKTTAVKKAAKSPAAKAPAAKTAATKAAAKPATKSAATKPSATKPAGLAEGSVAPDFKLPRDGGGEISRADFAGRKLVLFFYPKANTPGCTREAIDFTRLAADFKACGTAVLGVSADSVKAQDSFRDKHQLATPLLSDPTHAMLEAYGAWGEKSLYGRKFQGIIRTTVLIDADGRVARVWRNVKVDGHADQVLAAAQS
ncbi:peroxiredoxin [Rhodopseudomonas palustris]|uniref:peroxiredoxin n=1 Tax=Rhodopseudomonas palustris TaxID=1076 RepID=UPI000E5AB0DD|nr:peroxiredoxin [Rhodopseudomonas palustris]QLH71460.1 peroxiredoxin [Rhodopseudomonas palustris]RIA02099.1 peroxiredoxin [Rhodopseudomonas palustris]